MPLKVVKESSVQFAGHSGEIQDSLTLTGVTNRLLEEGPTDSHHYCLKEDRDIATVFDDGLSPLRRPKVTLVMAKPCNCSL